LRVLSKLEEELLKRESVHLSLQCMGNGPPGPSSPPEAEPPAQSAHPSSPRRSKRARMATKEDAFSPSAGWSQYEKARVGLRHASTRDVSYQEAIDLMRDVRGHLSTIIQPRGVSHDEAVRVIKAMQAALVDIVDEDEKEANAPFQAEAQRSRQAHRAESSSAQLRVQDGLELRHTLKEIIALEKAGKLDDARGLAASALDPVAEDDIAAKQLSVRRAELAKKRAKEMRDHFFSLGGWELTSDVLKRFINTPEVKRLMPGAATKTRAEEADAKFSSELLAAAKRFFSDTMGRDKGGRRSEEDMNIFWAAIAALMPKDLLANRGGRAASRILGVHYRVVKTGVGIRANLEASASSRQCLGVPAPAPLLGTRTIASCWRRMCTTASSTASDVTPLTCFPGSTGSLSLAGSAPLACPATHSSTSYLPALGPMTIDMMCACASAVTNATHVI